MTLILDSSGLFSASDADQRFHQATREALGRAERPLILSHFVLAELDYMILTRYGHSEELSYSAKSHAECIPWNRSRPRMSRRRWR